MFVCVFFFFGYLTQISTFLYIETLAFSDDFFFPLRLVLGSKFHDIFHSVLFFFFCLDEREIRFGCWNSQYKKILFVFGSALEMQATFLPLRKSSVSVDSL